jgi:hypothetical protein
LLTEDEVELELKLADEVLVLVGVALVDGVLVGAALVVVALVLVAAAAPLVVTMSAIPESLSNPAVTTSVDHKS